MKTETIAILYPESRNVTDRIGTPFNGSCQYRIAFLCPVRGIVEIFRSIPVVADEFEQAALVRAAIAEFRNQQ